MEFDKKKRKAQITIFIVIGIILLIAIGLFFVFRQLGIPRAEIAVPEEVAPVKELVEQCLETTLGEAVVLVGMQGGYTTVPEDLATSPYGHLSIAGPYMTPMWYYSGTLRIPEIFEIEGQIDDYVKENIDFCINNFTDVDAYEVNILGDGEFTTAINKEDVTVFMTMPVEILKGNQRFEWEEFSTKIDAKLQKAYDIARQVLENENLQMFLEQVTIDLMAIDPDIPFTNFRFDKCHRLTWSKRTISSKLKDTLYYNMPRLRVNRTMYERFDRNEDYQRNHFLMNAIDQDEKDITVGFRYDKDWPLLLDARPSEGDTLKSNSGKGFAKYMAFLCMNFYHFTYDVEFPVEIIVREDTSFDDQGFVFRFGTPVIIKQNQGSRDYLAEPELVVPRFDVDFCGMVTDEAYDIRAIDPVTNEELMANISFECVVFRCELGRTDLSEDDLAVSLKTRLPSTCTGGNIIVNGEYDEFFNRGYFESVKHISMDEISASEPIEVELRPYKKVELEFKKFQKDDLSTPIELGPDDEVLIQIENSSEDFFEFYTWGIGEENDKLNLLLLDDFTYDVTIMLTKGEDYIGGYSTEWKLSYADVADNDVVEFPIIFDDVTNDAETVELISYVETGDYVNTLKPILK